LLSFLTMWASETSVPAMAAAFLAQLLVRTENQSTLLIFQSIVTKVFTDLQHFIQDIPFPTDKEAFEALCAQPVPAESDDLCIPVTLLSAATIQKMVKLLASSKGIDNLAPSADYGPNGQSSPPNRYEVFHRHDSGDFAFSNILRRRKPTVEFPNSPTKGHSRTASSSGSDFSEADVVDLAESDDDSPRSSRPFSPEVSHMATPESEDPSTEEKSTNEPEGEKKGMSSKMRRGLTRLRCSLRFASKSHHSQQNLNVKTVLSGSSSSQLATSTAPEDDDEPVVKVAETAPIPVPQRRPSNLAVESPRLFISSEADTNSPNPSSSGSPCPFGSV